MVQNVILVTSNHTLSLEINSDRTGPERLRLEALLATYVPPATTPPRPRRPC